MAYNLAWRENWGDYCYTHFKDEETEAQRDEVTQVKSHCQEMIQCGFRVRPAKDQRPQCQ